MPPPDATTPDHCPCGSGLALTACCGRYHAGEAPPTAEALMRARYTAFALGRVEFLAATGPDSDRAALAESLERTRWIRLRIESTEAGREDDANGFVTFAATFLEGGRFGVLHERSRFARELGRWRYLDGDTRVSRLAVGRNDPCPCLSGKKAKACHLA